MDVAIQLQLIRKIIIFWRKQNKDENLVSLVFFIKIDYKKWHI